MKYGVLVVTPVSQEKDRAFANLGDMVQTEAILYIYEQMGINADDIVKIDLKEVNDYAGEYLILPININLSLNWIIDIFPMSSHIIPVFLGLSYFSAQKFPDKVRAYFKMYEPIGCRDEFTMRTMHQNNIQAYLYGCVTALLPKREDKEGRNKIFFVDVPQSFFDFMDDRMSKLEGDVNIISHISNDKEVCDIKYIEKITRQLLDDYKDNAKLVVTSRLHCMSPCMAMGIPVIPVTDNISPRMGWIDKFLDIYSTERYKEVDWRGQLIEYEDVKEKMLNIAMDKIRATREKYEQIVDLSYFYEVRKRGIYGNLYVNRLECLPQDRKEKFEYILWGAGQIGMNVYNVISERYPNSKLRAVGDSYCTGEFYGVEIQKPDVLTKDTKEYILITTTSGEACAKEKLREIGKKENRDYMSMATTAG